MNTFKTKKQSPLWTTGHILIKFLNGTLSRLVLIDKRSLFIDSFKLRLDFANNT
jgi:hypothetical protein